MTVANCNHQAESPTRHRDPISREFWFCDQMDSRSSEITCNSRERIPIEGVSNRDQSNAVEQIKLKLLRDILEKEDPSYKVTDDATLRRFLYARELNVEKASELYVKYRKWRQKFVPLGYIPETMIPNELHKKLVCMQGFDKNQRPIAVVLLARHTPIHGGIEDLKRLFVYSFDKMSASSSRGREQFSIIADLEGWTYKNVDIRGALAVLEILQDYYPERLGKVYLIHLPYIFWAAWKIVHPFIDKVTKRKIMLVEEKDVKATLLKDIDEDQLPNIYGGELPLIPVQDAIVPNWPPT